MTAPGGRSARVSALVSAKNEDDTVESMPFVASIVALIVALLFRPDMVL